MQDEIRAQVSWLIQLDQAEQFELTGTERHGTTPCSILVDSVNQITVVANRQEVSGLRFSGRRLLKSGKNSFQTRRVDLPDGHELIPPEIAQRAVGLRERVEKIRTMAKEVADA